MKYDSRSAAIIAQEAAFVTGLTFPPLCRIIAPLFFERYNEKENVT